MMRRHLVLRDSEGLIAELERQATQTLSSRQFGVGSGAHPQPATSDSVLRQVNEAKEVAESQAILHALDVTHWNRKQAARLLGIDYKALLYRMKKLSIEGTRMNGSDVAIPPAHDNRPFYEGAKRYAALAFTVAILALLNSSPVFSIGVAGTVL
jgi:hypothetical protein